MQDEFPAKLDTDDDPDTNMAVVRGLSEDGSVIPTEDGSLDASSKRVSSLDASAKQKSTQGASANWRGKVGDDESVSSGSGSGSGSASYSCSSGIPACVAQCWRREVAMKGRERGVEALTCCV